jgi:pyruvate formate lyase activating enzyme
MQYALIFDIKRYCINDGPGIRITIFLKGCPLACRWCHNPESISPKIQKLYTAAKCIGCGECVRICPVQACRMTEQGIVTDTDLCTLCGKCAEVCPTKATEMSGQLKGTEELLAEIRKEIPFFDQSGGGVTFSGGEPLLHHDFLVEILDACGASHIHRAVDTSGHVKIEVLLDVAKRTDLFLYDLKLMDPVRHRLYTGVSNQKILANLTALAETGAAIQVRVPLIKGINDDDENIEATAAFVAGLAGEKKPVSLLPYHNIAAGKHMKLGQAFDASGMSEPTDADIERVTAIFAAHGLTATVGG